MTKKILSTVAAAAILTTGAMAYDSMGGMAFAAAATATTAKNVTATTPITKAYNGLGQSLIFPAYFVGNGWETNLRVINTSSTNAVVAKVVLYSGKDSKEVRDFNIYLSANDEWTGTIKVDSDGTAKLISTDDSSPLTDGTMASAAHPMKSDAITVPSGYIEVIGLASPASTAHADHVNLRKAYAKFAKAERAITTPIQFSNGVITSTAEFPYITSLGKVYTSGTSAYTFGTPVQSLVGDVRITDTANGKDMDLQGIRVNNVVETGNALAYIEGEAANIADRDIAAAGTYTGAQMAPDANAFDTNNVWMSYGDTSSMVNNQLLVTSPFKRILAIANKPATANTSYTAGKFNGLKTDANKKIANYGKFSALALIFDKSENQASASQFSPASTPVLNFNYEVSASEGNPVQTDNISYYLNAAGSAFTSGYIKLVNTATATAMPGIFTQMMATEPKSGTVVTNWIFPAQN